MEYFVYTRTRDVDYKLMFSPSDTLCPPDIRQFFIKKVRGVINVERYDTCLDTPTWFLCKKDGVELFGVGVNNKELDGTAYKDFTGRGVRGFFGIIARDGELESVPMDLAFFREFYQQKVVPLWECQQTQFKQKGITVTIDFSMYDVVRPASSCDGLNVDCAKTVVHGSRVTVKDLLSMALCCQRNTDVVGEISDIEQAYDSDYKFMNAVVCGNDSCREIIHKADDEADKVDVVDNHENGKNDEDIPDFKADWMDMSKKVLRPKVIAVVAVICIMIIMLMQMKRCSQKSSSDVNTETPARNIQNQKPSSEMKTDTIILENRQKNCLSNSGS